MLFLLDANVLINANRDYYSFESVPEFWEWIIYCGEKDLVKIPVEIYEELKDGTDNLSRWMKQPRTKEALLLDEEVDKIIVQKILKEGYGENLTDSDLEQIGRDPFLISYAIKDNMGRCVVTSEISKPSRKRENRQLPDVCNTFAIPWCNSFIFFKELKFSTKWKESIE